MVTGKQEAFGSLPAESIHQNSEAMGVMSPSQGYYEGTEIIYIFEKYSAVSYNQYFWSVRSLPPDSYFCTLSLFLQVLAFHTSRILFSLSFLGLSCMVVGATKVPFEELSVG